MKPVILPIRPQAFVRTSRGRFRRRPLRVHLGQRALVFGRENLDEFPARRLPVLEDRERERASGVTQVPLDQLAQQRLVGPAGVQQAALAGGSEILFRLRLLGLGRAPAPSRPSRCCSAWRTCRRRIRTRCRRSFRPRNCAPCGPAPRPCRRSCTRSRGHPSLRPPPTAPELRTQKRSPATPRKYASPAMAPYITVLPMTMLASGFAGHAGSG